MNTKKVKKPNIVTVMIVATVLLATATLTMTTIENTFAYTKNQAKSDTNECGNGQASMNIGCQNIDSQIQGDENAVNIIGLTGDQVPITGFICIVPPPPSCEKGFVFDLVDCECVLIDDL